MAKLGCRDCDHEWETTRRLKELGQPRCSGCGSTQYDILEPDPEPVTDQEDEVFQKAVRLIDEEYAGLIDLVKEGIPKDLAKEAREFVAEVEGLEIVDPDDRARVRQLTEDAGFVVRTWSEDRKLKERLREDAFEDGVGFGQIAGKSEGWEQGQWDGYHRGYNAGYWQGSVDVSQSKGSHGTLSGSPG